MKNKPDRPTLSKTCYVTLNTHIFFFGLHSTSKIDPRPPPSRLKPLPVLRGEGCPIIIIIKVILLDSRYTKILAASLELPELSSLSGLHSARPVDKQFRYLRRANSGLQLFHLWGDWALPLQPQAHKDVNTGWVISLAPKRMLFVEPLVSTNISPHPPDCLFLLHSIQ